MTAVLGGCGSVQDRMAEKARGVCAGNGLVAGSDAFNTCFNNAYSANMTAFGVATAGAASAPVVVPNAAPVALTQPRNMTCSRNGIFTNCSAY